MEDLRQDGIGGRGGGFEVAVELEEFGEEGEDEGEGDLGALALNCRGGRGGGTRSRRREMNMTLRIDLRFAALIVVCAILGECGGWWFC